MGFAFGTFDPGLCLISEPTEVYYSVCVLKDIKIQYLMKHNVMGISMEDWNKCRSTIRLSVIHSIYIYFSTML